jgi:hypothetical protein
MSTQVFYNSRELTPTPFVNRSEKGIDYGARWGYEDSITLNGRYLVSSGTLQSGVISDLRDKFAGQFVSFEVKDAGTSILRYENCILEDFSIQSDKFYPGTYINYSAKIKNINVPSGVTDPSNEYAFIQNPDGTVDIDHKISAKGIVTSSSNALTNAQNFVKSYTGIGGFAGAFVSAGTPVFLSRSETVDRLSATYSISEKYKYTSGENLSYVYIYSLSLDESKDSDYKKLGLSIDLIGSSLTSNIATLRTTAAAIDPLTFLSSKYGISTSNVILNNFSISENSGQNAIKISTDFFSGIGDEYAGFFSYDVDLNWDKISNVRSYSANGSYISTAPIDKRNEYINTFLNTTIANKNYTGYLYNIITNSVLYTDANYTTSYTLNPTPKTFSLNQNTGAGTLSMSASFNDEDFIAGAVESSFNISTELPVHLFEFKPSANVEGVYIIQDLGSETREKVTTSVDIKTENSKVKSLTTTASSIIADNFKPALTNTPFTISSGVNTGIYDVKADAAFWNKTSKYPQVKTDVCYSSLIKSIRPAGYKFGR